MTDRVNQYNGGKYKRNSQYFDKIDSQIKVEILGYLFADGNNYPPENKIQVRCATHSESIIEQLRQELQYEKEIVRYQTKLNGRGYPSSVLCIKDKNISKKLESLGMVQAKSLILKYPNWLSENQHQWFISGYWQGDGICSITNNDSKGRWGQIGFIGTENIINNINIALIRNDIKMNISQRGKMSYLRTSSKISAIKFYDFVKRAKLKDPVKMNRFTNIVKEIS